MELSSPEMNSEPSDSEVPQGPGLSSRQAAQSQATGKPRQSAGPPCRTHRCGRCGRCLDNARWERIFREKFADPTYYEERLVKYSSPLA